MSASGQTALIDPVGTRVLDGPIDNQQNGLQVARGDPS